MKSLIVAVACLFGVGYANAGGCHNAAVVQRVEFVDYVPVQNILFLNHANLANVDYNVQLNFVRVVRDRNIRRNNVEVRVEKVINRNRGQFFDRFRNAAQALTQRNVRVERNVQINVQRVRNIRVH